jgi:hypothetical protein
MMTLAKWFSEELKHQVKLISFFWLPQQDWLSIDANTE